MPRLLLFSLFFCFSVSSGRGHLPALHDPASGALFTAEAQRAFCGFYKNITQAYAGKTGAEGPATDTAFTVSW